MPFFISINESINIQGPMVAILPPSMEQNATVEDLW